MVCDYFCLGEKGDATTMLTYGDSTSQISNDLSKLTARLRQQPPFRYVDEVIHIDREQRSMRGFRPWSRERHPCEVVVSAAAAASLFSVFSGGHASVLEATSFAGAGLVGRSVVVGNSCSGGDSSSS